LKIFHTGRNIKDEWTVPADLGKKPDRYMDEMYVNGAAEYEKPEVAAKIKDLVVKWEANDPTILELWKTVLDFSHEGQSQTLLRLGARFDNVWHEHEHYEEGKKYVEEGLKKGIFKKLEDGAILTDLESFDLSDTIVQKNDGTSLYITQDLALTDLKKKKHNADHLVWVIGPEQSLALATKCSPSVSNSVSERGKSLHIFHTAIFLLRDKAR
jgi:arginyl-tRNA synthetase